MPGGEVSRNLSDRDDRMGAKIKTPKNPQGFQQNPKKYLDKHLPPPPPPNPPKKTHMPNFRAFWILTALEAPKNFFFSSITLWRMRFFFENAKKSCVNQTTQPRSQGSLLVVPKEREPGNEVESHPPNKLAKVVHPKNPKISNPKNPSIIPVT